MDMNSKANAVNAAAAGERRPCPKCGAFNRQEAHFCVTCGAPMPAPATAFAPAQPEQATAFAPAQAPAFAPAQPAQAAVFTPVEAAESEPESAFAAGLPGWDILPPHVVVRRKKTK